MKYSSRPPSLLIALILALGLYVPISLRAATETWVGNGGTAVWSDPMNWSPAMQPANNDDLVFAGSSNPNTNNDILPNQSYNSISFDSTAVSFTLSGQTIGLNSGGITNNSSNLQTLSFNVADPMFPAFQGILIQQNQTFNAA